MTNELKNLNEITKTQLDNKLAETVQHYGNKYIELERNYIIK